MNPVFAILVLSAALTALPASAWEIPTHGPFRTLGHYVFLADLRQGLADSDRMIPRGTLEQEARARFDRYRKAERQGVAKGVMHGEARDVVDGQRELLLRASLKEGAVATLSDPN